VDINYGIVGNQELFERKMMSDIGLLSLPDGDKVSNNSNKKRRCLDIGCGRGRVAMHVARVTGAQVHGMNIDASQIREAKAYAKRLGMDLEQQTDFKVASLNDHPLPYPDEYFDAAYNIQAFTYSKDLNKLFDEIYRILKPGGKFSYLDWVLLDKFDECNVRHVELMEKSMPALGAVTNPRYTQVEDAMKQAGFVILLSEEASCDGPNMTQSPLINKERKHFAWVRFFAKYLLPSRYMDMLLRLKMHVSAFVEGTDERIFTTSYQIVCQKKSE
jgi:sterol 24-C-methyltransferase